MIRKRTLISLLFFGFLLLLSPLVRAESKPADNGEGWEQVNGQMMQPGESIPASTLVGAAYGFIWVMVAGFVYSVWRRTTAVERDLASLRARIAAHEPPQSRAQ